MGYYLDNGQECVNVMAFFFNSADDMEGYINWKRKYDEEAKRLMSGEIETRGESICSTGME